VPDVILMVRDKCWSCHSTIGSEEIVCKQCSKIQPFAEGTDYFSCFGLRHVLQIDLKKLETRFHELSRQFHPDYYYGKGETERTISLENSALVNKAYRALRDPFSRVEYLIQLEEGSKKGVAAKIPQEFLEEIFELQEALEEFRSTSDPMRRDPLQGRLREALKMLETRLSDLDSKLFESFKRWDELQQKKDPGLGQQDRTSLIQQMKESLSYRTYFKNLIQDIVHLLEGHTTRREIRH
jgi:molecular chaperone HscB